MTEMTGKSVSHGIAIGKVRVFTWTEDKIKRSKVKDIHLELVRLDNAISAAKEELASLAARADDFYYLKIFSAQAMLLDDPAFMGAVREKIEKECLNAEYAVAVTSDNFSIMFENMDDETFMSKSSDIKDISNRLIKVLKGKNEAWELGEEPVILMAEDLTPSQTIKLDESKILSIVTKKGSHNSHTAIISRGLSIPALVGVEINKKYDGLMAIVDGQEGKIIIDPSEEVVEKYRSLKELHEKGLVKEGDVLSPSFASENEEGKRTDNLKVMANISSYKEVTSDLAKKADGIGLYRSEFLFIGKDNYPSEDEQFSIYKRILEIMAGKPVIIRTLDVGADKKADYMKIDEEENPALGVRGIRFCLENREIFKTQLRALYRASSFGNLSIMYPMITSVDEVRKIKEITKEVRMELREAGVEIGMPAEGNSCACAQRQPVREGIMIETPAAAIMSDELAELVDFFSIGTNDLTQYTFAADRQNCKVDGIYNANNQAIMRLIKYITKNAHEAGIEVGVCGEIAADSDLRAQLVEIGIDEISVSR